MKMDILQKYNQTNLFGKYLDLKLDIVKPGDITYKVKVQKQHLATVKSAHGGVYMPFLIKLLVQQH